MPNENAASSVETVFTGTIRGYESSPDKNGEPYVRFGLEQSDGSFINCVAFSAVGWPTKITSGKGARVKGQLQLARKRLKVSGMIADKAFDKAAKAAPVITGFGDDDAPAAPAVPKIDAF